MAIKLKNGAEFLHIPKTGGSWVTKILEDLDLIECDIGGNKHADYDRLLYFNGQIRDGRDHLKQAGILASMKLKRMFIGSHNEQKIATSPIRFCFVRHPLSWYESWWKYMCGRGWNNWGTENSAEDWHPNSILNGLGSDDFNEFVRKIIRKRPGYVSELYYMFTKSGIDFIGKTESLTDDLIKILELLDVDFDKQRLIRIERVNISKRPKLPIVWDPGLRKTVMALELPALIHFGYHNDDENLELSEEIMPNKAVQATSLRAVPDL